MRTALAHFGGFDGESAGHGRTNVGQAAEDRKVVLVEHCGGHPQIIDKCVHHVGKAQAPWRPSDPARDRRRKACRRMHHVGAELEPVARPCF